jgi:hypothetical protein
VVVCTDAVDGLGDAFFPALINFMKTDPATVQQGVACFLPACDHRASRAMPPTALKMPSWSSRGSTVVTTPSPAGELASDNLSLL